MAITEKPVNDHELPENLKILSKLGGVIWLASLIALFVLPNTIGAGGQNNPFSSQAFILALLGPIAWLAAWIYQHHLLQNSFETIAYHHFFMWQIVFNVPAMFLFLFYPYAADGFRSEMLQKIILLSCLQGLSIIGCKQWAFVGFQLPLMSRLRLFLLDVFSFVLYWGIFVAPTDLSISSESKPWAIKYRMHALQTLVEIYAVDAKGLYPENTKVLLAAATAGGYAKDLGVTICEYYPLWLALRDLSRPQGRLQEKAILDKGDPVRPCRLLYLQAQHGRNYFIYGFGPDAKLIQDKNQDYVLSNS